MGNAAAEGMKVGDQMIFGRADHATPDDGEDVRSFVFAPDEHGRLNTDAVSV